MAIIARWRILILLASAAFLAACAAPAASTLTYTLLPTATAILPPTGTATPLPPTETQKQPAPLPRPSSTPVVPPTPTPTLAPWTPQPYTPPTAHPLALSPANAGQIVALATMGRGSAVDVAWSPDSALLAVAARDWVDLYDTDTAVQVAHYALTSQQIAFSPTSGDLVVVVGKQVRWLDLATGAVVREQRAAIGAIDYILFSPGGDWLALSAFHWADGGAGSYELEVINVATGAVAFIHAGDSALRGNMAFSPDGSTLALANSSGLVLIDVDTGAELAKFDTPSLSVAYRADGSELLVLTADGLQTLTPATGKWTPLAGLPGGVGFDLSSDGHTLALIGTEQNDGREVPQIAIWDLTSRQRLTVWPSRTEPARVSFSPDGRWFAVAKFQDEVQVVDLTAPTALHALNYSSGFAQVAFGPPTVDENPTVWASLLDGELWGWNIGKNNSYQRPAPTPGNVSAVAFDTDGTLGQLISLDFSVRDQAVVTSYAVGEVMVSAADSGQVRFSLACENVTWAPPQISRAGGTFATLCGAARVWDIATGALLAERHGGATVFVEWRNQWLVDTPDPVSVKLIPITGGAAVLTLPYPADHQGNPLEGLVASADGRWLAAPLFSAEIMLWDTTGVVSPAVLVGHELVGGEGPIYGIAALTFNPSTNLLASAGYDGTVRLWDPTTGLQLRLLYNGWPQVTDLAYSDDGRFLAASINGGQVFVWGLPSP